MDWQRGPPSKRYRPNEPPHPSRQWMNPPNSSSGGSAMIHPSRQSQIMHPPSAAPYYPQTLPPPPPQPAPYYNANTLPPTPVPMNPMNPMMHSNKHHSSRDRRHTNRSLDPRRPRGGGRAVDMSNNHNNRPNPTLLNILHIASDDNGNFGAFAVTLNQIYGPKMIDNLPFGQSSLNSIVFDGRLKVSQVISFLIATMNSPKKKVRVLELTALAASDKKNYDTFVSFWTKSDRLAVVDKEYNMGLLLYLIPPKLIHEKYDQKKKGKGKVSIAELLNINQSAKDCIWMISIESSQKYLIWKQKVKDKEMKKKELKKQKVKAKRKKALNEAADVLSDISLTDSDSNQSDFNDSDSNQDSDDDYTLKLKKKQDDIVKSDLIISLEKLYKLTGQKLPN